MNRSMRAIAAILLIGVIVFSVSSILRNLPQVFRIDVTDEQLYSLSDGTKTVLGKLHQPLTLKLYFSRSVAMNAPDQIQFFTKYYTFVKTLAEEYVRRSKGMLRLETIDPLPFSDDEEDALRYGLKRFPISEEENFFFGAVVTTGFGVVKQIPFFTPDRDNFVEYDLTRLIDSAITRDKTRLGILSSLPVMGDAASPYMAQMKMMQGQPLAPSWKIVQQLQQRYELSAVPTDTEAIEDLDLLLVAHPKDLAEPTLFAIDQFVMKGGRAVFLLDPYSFVEQPDPQQGQQAQFAPKNSDLSQLLRKWGVEMEEGKLAGDRLLAQKIRTSAQAPLEPLIGYLNVGCRDCVNRENVITSELQELTMLFPGSLKQVEPDGESSEDEPPLTFTPLVQTTQRGNTWEIESPIELLYLDPKALMQKFTEGDSAVILGALVTGRFQSNFPEGIDITEDAPVEANQDDQAQPVTRHLDAVAAAEKDGAIAVFSDVDFISDMLAYQNTFFGLSATVGHNSDLLLNTLDDFSGSGDLIGLRTRGSFQRPFIVVEQIKQEAEARMAREENAIQAEIDTFNEELQALATQQEGREQKVLESSILDKRQDLELKIHQAERRLRQVHMKKRARIDALGKTLQQINSLAAPLIILGIGIVVGVRRRILRQRHLRTLRTQEHA
ncbi:hypothetical protein CSB45_09960 [candidate division KSB3 bacterium]|uniref:Uncharacterized protein n=1 Tax=candidate division KSB3 bacterium TaxID=2044937 RepID=A0A2G6E464_9BACT|nr:MAG: hypothetical protein CSB45_09960 [candidate division KSB3 bacterium]PIE29358.1 MAG: hypothetical protein CSA57_09130 [candidate division KSB3 bacterium]